MFKTWKRITAGFAAACCLFATVPSAIFTSAADSTNKYEAENGTLDGSAVIIEDDEASGGECVKVTSSFTITIDVDVETTGYYDLHIVGRCNTGKDEKKINYVFANDTEVEFTYTTKDFQSAVAQNLKLEAGKNTIEIYDYYGYVDIDYFTIEESATVNKDYYSGVSSQLINPNATASAKRLMQFLTDSYGKYIISGQQANKGYNSNDVKAIEKLTGELPAIIGLDLMDYSLSSVEQHGSSSNAIETAIEVSNAGGIVSFCWHWRMYDEYLLDGTDGGNPRWWGAFYSKNVDMDKFDLAAIMDDPDCKEYKLLVADIDYVAEQLKVLQGKDIPVLFRPLHEGGGDARWNNPWFWWGSGGSEAYIKLWKLMYDRLTNVHGINNLIWVWNGQIKSYYPGDEYVDIISEDIYNGKNDYQPNSDRFISANEYTDASKIVALSENGNLFDPEDAFESNAKWSWFMSWSGEYSANGSYNNANDRAIWKTVYNSDKVITLSELPDLKTYEIDENIPATNVNLDITEQEVELGEEFNLSATFSPANSTEIPTWSSSDESVAVVDGGKVTTVGVGEAVITCKINNGKTATCVVTVNPTQVMDLKVKSTSGSSVTLTWTAIESVDDYEVMLMDANGKELSTVMADSNTYEVKGLDSETGYKFRVRAHKSYNDKDLYGKYSAIVSAETTKSTTNEPTKIDTNKNNNGSNTIPNVNSSSNTINVGTSSGGTNDNSANTGSRALSTFGLTLAGAFVILVAKKRK